MRVKFFVGLKLCSLINVHLFYIFVTLKCSSYLLNYSTHIHTYCMPGKIGSCAVNFCKPTLAASPCVNIAGGRHATALTVDGKVFSWGEGDDGKLGHFSRM